MAASICRSCKPNDFQIWTATFEIDFVGDFVERKLGADGDVCEGEGGGVGDGAGFQAEAKNFV